MQDVRESLNSHSLPPIVRYKNAKTYDKTSTLVLDMARVRCRFKKDLSILTNARIRDQDASDRARENDIVGRMARETGRTSKFPSSTSSLVDERMSESGTDFATDHPLRRVHSTDSDSAWSDCTLPTEPVNPDSHLSADTGEEDNYCKVLFLRRLFLEAENGL